MKLLKSLVKFILLVAVWTTICIVPELMIPLFVAFPIILIFIVLLFAKVFMGSGQISNDFIAGATVVDTINRKGK